MAEKPGIAHEFDDCVLLWAPKAYDKMYGAGAVDECLGLVRKKLVTKIIGLLEFEVWRRGIRANFEKRDRFV